MAVPARWFHLGHFLPLLPHACPGALYDVASFASFQQGYASAADSLQFELLAVEARRNCPRLLTAKIRGTPGQGMKAQYEAMGVESWKYELQRAAVLLSARSRSHCRL